MLKYGRLLSVFIDEIDMNFCIDVLLSLILCNNDGINVYSSSIVMPCVLYLIVVCNMY